MTVGLTGLPAGITVSTMACLLAAVETTVEFVATDQEALVLNILGGQKDRSDAHSSAPITNFYCTVFNMTIISLIYLLFVSVLKHVIYNIPQFVITISL